MAGQVWSENARGGYLYSLNLSDTLRQVVQPTCKFRQFADIKDATMKGKKRGSIFTWDVFGNVATQGGTITEGQEAPETEVPIYQGSLTITEAINSVPFTAKLDNLSKFSVKDLIKRALRHDAAKFFDSQVYTEVNKTPLRVYPAGGTSTTAVSLSTTGTVGGSSSVAFGSGHAKAINDMMNERNIPTFTHGDYYAISWPSTLASLRDDMEDLYKYTGEGLKMIKAGEIGRYAETRYIKHTNPGVAKAGTTATDWIFFMGEDVCAEAVCVPEEIRGKLPTNYGLSQGVAWYYLGGFGLAHTSEMSIPDVRVIKWESAT